MEANPNRVHYYLTYERLHDRDGFPWGAYHEVGHGHQESVWTMGFWECTVNWFSVVMTEVKCSLLKCINIHYYKKSIFKATENITDESWTYDRTHRLTNFNNKGRDWDNLGNWECLDSYAMLGEAFGWESYTQTMGRYQTNATLYNTSGDAR